MAYLVSRLCLDGEAKNIHDMAFYDYFSQLLRDLGPGEYLYQLSEQAPESSVMHSRGISHKYLTESILAMRPAGLQAKVLSVKDSGYMNHASGTCRATPSPSCACSTIPNWSEARSGGRVGWHTCARSPSLSAEDAAFGRVYFQILYCGIFISSPSCKADWWDTMPATVMFSAMTTSTSGWRSWRMAVMNSSVR